MEMKVRLTEVIRMIYTQVPHEKVKVSFISLLETTVHGKLKTFCIVFALIDETIRTLFQIGSNLFWSHAP